jgi:hypothetical protein
MQGQLEDHLDQVRECTALLIKAHDAIERSAASLDSIDGSVSNLTVSAEGIQLLPIAVERRKVDVAADSRSRSGACIGGAGTGMGIRRCD